MTPAKFLEEFLLLKDPVNEGLLDKPELAGDYLGQKIQFSLYRMDAFLVFLNYFNVGVALQDHASWASIQTEQSDFTFQLCLQPR